MEEGASNSLRADSNNNPNEAPSHHCFRQFKYLELLFILASKDFG